MYHEERQLFSWVSILQGTAAGALTWQKALLHPEGSQI